MSGGAVVRPSVAIPEEQVVRYTFQERLYHWINAIAYTYLLTSGLALFTPHMYWLAAVLGGGPTIRFWHPWIGVLYMITIFWMHSKWKGDMVTTNEDKEWQKHVKDYVENRDDKMPPQHRFNAGQKQFWWVMLYASIVLLLTGIVMWFPEEVPRSLMWIRPIIVFIHSATALITIAGFLIHVYMSVFVTPGSMKGMLDGTVSANWARHHHRLWYEKITGRRK
jgi:formate dehydrogenase subunit gamma